MFHACVRRFDVTGIVGIFWEINRAQVIFDYILQLKVLKIPYLKENPANIILQAFRNLSLLAMVRQWQRISMHDSMEVICWVSMISAWHYGNNLWQRMMIYLYAPYTSISTRMCSVTLSDLDIQLIQTTDGMEHHNLTFYYRFTENITAHKSISLPRKYD